eukprot:1147514-Pelagomonas_calceolata.AAC.7
MSNCCWESRGGSWGALCLKLEAFLEEALMLALLLLHLARWLMFQQRHFPWDTADEANGFLGSWKSINVKKLPAREPYTPYNTPESKPRHWPCFLGLLACNESMINDCVCALGSMKPNWLRKGKKIWFVTNNSSKTRATYVKKLMQLGVTAHLLSETAREIIGTLVQCILAGRSAGQLLCGCAILQQHQSQKGNGPLKRINRRNDRTGQSRMIKKTMEAKRSSKVGAQISPRCGQSIVWVARPYKIIRQTALMLERKGASKKHFKAKRCIPQHLIVQLHFSYTAGILHT